MPDFSFAEDDFEPGPGVTFMNPLGIATLGEVLRNSTERKMGAKADNIPFAPKEDETAMPFLKKLREQAKANPFSAALLKSLEGNSTVGPDPVLYSYYAASEAARRRRAAAFYKNRQSSGVEDKDLN